MKFFKTLDEMKKELFWNFERDFGRLFAAYAIYVARNEAPALYDIADINFFLAKETCGDIVYDGIHMAFVSKTRGWGVFLSDIQNIIREEKESLYSQQKQQN